MSLCFHHTVQNKQWYVQIYFSKNLGIQITWLIVLSVGQVLGFYGLWSSGVSGPSWTQAYTLLYLQIWMLVFYSQFKPIKSVVNFGSWLWISQFIFVMGSSGASTKVEHVTFSVFYLIKVLIRRGTFCWKLHLNRTTIVVPKWFETIENKRNAFLFFWLYLTINAPTFDWSR